MGLGTMPQAVALGILSCKVSPGLRIKPIGCPWQLTSRDANTVVIAREVVYFMHATWKFGQAVRMGSSTDHWTLSPCLLHKPFVFAGHLHSKAPPGLMIHMGQAEKTFNLPTGSN